MTLASNIVVEWLHSLHLGEYSESFIDNGYDDLEICKQISEPDLDAIGVLKQSHRARLLQSVKTLREEGAASVYFSLEESSACLCDEISSNSNSKSSEKDCCQISGQAHHLRASPSASSSSGGHELSKFVDEYNDENNVKSELVRIPRTQLKLLLQEKLMNDGIRLACQPYTTAEGERGYLEGLASRYADLFRTHYSDVLELLDELRRHETNASPRIPGTQQNACSQSQPIYVPGKYSPSSCLSDKEEDEIYGFGYGVFGRQMLQQRQQKLALASQNAALSASIQNNQQTYSCLSPRSAFFYEFPPNEQGQNTSKKKTTFSRLLRTLKTHRKDKQQNNQAQGSPRHNRNCRTTAAGLPQRVDTPDSVLQSGLGPAPMEMGHTILRSMVDPRDYDRLRYMQMNGAQSNPSFEETIHRLKVQEALKKKERFNKEHEEILRDIRQGLMQLGRDGRSQLPGDDTYMYDEDARCGSSRMLEGVEPGIQHWYDEPPYESDPEDFLMGTGIMSAPDPTARITNGGRVCFTMNTRPEQRGEGIISLRSAGDISLPRDSQRSMPTMRGLILPQGHNNPPTIIPLRHSRASRESGDYASSDIQSEASALLEDTSGIVGRARTLRQDVQRKISRLRQDCSASSLESLPHEDPLMRCREDESDHREGQHPVLCRARALVDCTPSPYDKEALKFKAGDVIDVLQMNSSGLWLGALQNRIGHFKFINVEVLNERVPRRINDISLATKNNHKYRQKPGSVQELLQRLNLQEYISVFLLNGYEDLELFRELEPADLDYLRILHPEHRAKILTAVQLLHELRSGSENDLASSSEGDELSRARLSLHQSGLENNLGGTELEQIQETNSKADFRANIPLSTIHPQLQVDKSPLLRAGSVRFVDAQRGGCLSEKSSDSGISSSSLSSTKASLAAAVVGIAGQQPTKTH